MQFQIPQFIETEDKIFGPLSVKQFLYVAGATLLVIFLYFLFATWLWVVVAILIETTTLTFNLAKINGRPMRIITASAFSYVWNPRVYTYQPTTAALVAHTTTPTAQPTIKTNRAHPSVGLRSLLDKLITTKQAIPNREKPLPEVLKATSRESVEERYELIKKITGDEEVARRVDYR
ncbi:MAG: PrgI family protein [Patescibacteria group bacterium]|nr:PrgI family protein [Patescibacteria group bacterium]MCL5224128.1 PrgI family protein [Patescibacteria group bacterium]